MTAPLHPNPSNPLLAQCRYHPEGTICDCPAYLVVLGSIDIEMEAALALAPE
jgi:hypothetical protein